MTLEERAREAAEEARCLRCLGLILEDPLAFGTILGLIRVPGTDLRLDYQLCGRCGLGLREFLFPKIAEDDGFRYLREAFPLEEAS